MNNLPVPPEFIPEGAILLPHGHAYQDAYELPVAELPGSPASEDGEQPRVAVVRLSELWELSPEDVQAMARNDWRFWVRWSMVQGQIRLLKMEPLVPLARPYPWLDSAIPDSGPEGG